MSRLGKNINQCKTCVNRLQLRQLNSSGNTLDPEKMQAKSVVLSQWKLVNQLKNYFSKFSTDKTFENALNKEFAQFLQKIQPSVYGNELIRYFETLSMNNKNNKDKTDNNNNETTITTTTSPSQGTIIKDEEKSKGGSYSLPNVFNGLKLRLGVEEKVQKTCVPKWKAAKKVVSKEAIASRTHQILSLLATSQSEYMRLSKIEELCDHIKKYPEAKHSSVKSGAIGLLLRIRSYTKNQQVIAALHEALALLGHSKPLTGEGIRILSIDGGGVRGILVIEMLKKLEEFSGKPVREMFDFICGVSTGAIIASLIGLRQHSLDEVSETYKNLSTQIFNQSALKGTSNLVFSHSYYDTAFWEKLLKEKMGDQTLISTSRDPKCPKMCALSAVVNEARLSAYVFRNYSLPCRVQSQYMGGYNHLVWEAVRASAAAPTYFEEFKLGNKLHQDGGILYNNPTAIAIHEAKLLWPETPIQCIVSFGTGRTIPNPVEFCQEENQKINNSSWKNKFYAIIESATDTEGVHAMLSDLLPTNIYYRFNPYLTEMVDIAEIDPEKLKQLQLDAVMYLRRNEDKFQEVAKVLNKTKGVTKKTLDWLNLQKEIHGFNYKF